MAKRLRDIGVIIALGLILAAMSTVDLVITLSEWIWNKIKKL